MGIVNDLRSLSEEAWGRLRPRLEGLTDDEYFWEPAPGCWTIRPAGHGHEADWGFVVDADPPFTTIAWRLWHLVEVLGGERNAHWLGLQPEPLDRTSPPATAAGAIERVEQAYALWLGCLDRIDDERLSAKLGPRAGPYAEDSHLAYVLHQIDEFIHHAAEVGVLRDLYRATRPVDALIEACLRGDREAFEAAHPDGRDRLRSDRPDLLVEFAETGRWTGMKMLLEAGFPTEAASGRSALHHAAAAGALDVVKLLVARGADSGSKDPAWNETPAGWARYFGRTEVAEYLDSLSG